jgi:hypothetical protein
MEAFQFTPNIDLPLVSCTVVVFLMNFFHWAKSAELDSTASLPERLPRAILLVIVLFALLLFVCWHLDVAVWLIYVLLAILGLFISALAGSAPNPAAMLLFIAGLIREWCFGFPQLILRPESRTKKPRTEQPEDPWVGMKGVAVSPLIPTGIVEIGGEEVPAVSDVGTLIESGSPIVVTGRRSGLISVRTDDAA